MEYFGQFLFSYKSRHDCDHVTCDCDHVTLWSCDMWWFWWWWCLF